MYNVLIDDDNDIAFAIQFKTSLSSQLAIVGCLRIF